MSVDGWGWFAVEGGGALRRDRLVVPDPAAGEVVVKVRACGLCHTDLGFASAEVAPRHPLPLVLGHEIVGTVAAAGAGGEGLLGQDVLVPAVLPCGDCAFCRSGRGNACPRQKMPGNDVHGGFASHVLVPAGPLVRLGDAFEGAALRSLGVVADAVSTAWQACARAGIGEGDLVVVVGAGGVGGFAVQIAAALGARVVACDVKESNLARIAAFGAEATIVPSRDDPKALKKAVAERAKAWGIPSLRHRVIECSGTAAGQDAAYGLLGAASTLVLVGYTRDRVQVRLSNLMAFDATVHGTWGCPPEQYPAVLDLIRTGRVRIAPFVEEAPMDRVNDLLTAMAEHRLDRRMVLLPEA